MPRFCTAGLLSIPDYNTSPLCSKPSLLPSTRFSTLTSTFTTCTLTQTWWCHRICFFLCLSPSASLSCSLYHAYKFVYPCSCQLGSAYLPNLLSSLFISSQIFFVMFPPHWPNIFLVLCILHSLHEEQSKPRARCQAFLRVIRTKTQEEKIFSIQLNHLFLEKLKKAFID